MSASNAARGADAPARRSRHPVRVERATAAPVFFAAVLLAPALLALGWLLVQERTRFAGDYTHVDEIFFAVCATRGVVAGEWPPAGCHDNKAPLIYLVYQVADVLGGRMDLQAIKALGVALVASALGLVGWAAGRTAGLLGALVAMLLAALALGISSDMLALKTELLGTLPILGGAALLLGADAVPSARRTLAAGLLFGVALATKQTFVFAAIAAGAWLLLPPLSGQRPAGGRLMAGAAFGLGVIAPLVALGLWFWSRGQALDFLASLFVHAAGYGVVGDPLSGSQQAWKAGWILHQFGRVWPVSVVFAAALAAAFNWRAAADGAGRAPMRLWVLLALAMAAVPVVSRQFFTPHLIPAWLLMAVAGGAWVSGKVAPRGAAPRPWAALAVSALAGVSLMAVDSWYLNGDAAQRRAGQQHVLDNGSRLPDARGDFGYVLGTRPEFYFFNGIVPSSDVLYPQALAGAGASLPTAAGDSRLGRLHAQVQAHAERRLADQFAATPPRHVFVVDRWAGGGGRHTAVAALDAYLQRHCEPVRHVDGKPYQSGWLFACRTGDEAAGSPRRTARANG